MFVWIDGCEIQKQVLHSAYPIAQTCAMGPKAPLFKMTMADFGSCFPTLDHPTNMDPFAGTPGS